MNVRKSPQTLQVLKEFLESPGEWKYGYDISRSTGLKSGTLYPILMRLAENELLEADWESPDLGKPPRHIYRLTPGGLQYARREVESRARVLKLKPVFSGAKMR